MAQLVLVVVVAAFAGLIGYGEAGRVEERFNEGPWGVSASVCGVACFAAALVGGIVAMPLVFATEAGIGGYHGAADYERLYRKQLFRKPPWIWGVGSAVFAFAGALRASTITWGIVCVIAALVCSLLLVTVERDLLIADHQALATERNGLLAEKKTLISQRAQVDTTAKPHAQTHSHAVAAALRAEKQSARPRVPTFGTQSPVVPARQSSRQSANTRFDDGSDLLPRGARNTTQRDHDIGSSDLIPKRRP